MNIELRPISSITRGPRETSMELLRIIAIFMVLVVHADFAALGIPEADFSNFNAGLETLLRVGIEMASLVCVNVFILISGWFGIKPTVRGFMNFAFQVVFILTACYLVMLLFGMARFSGEGIAGCFCLTPSQWFVKSYAGLYLIAPLLNLFATQVTERQLRMTVILFYLYQTIWGFMSPNSTVADGYSVFSFIGLYLLARYMRLNYEGSRSSSWLWLYLLMTALSTVAFFTFPDSINVTSYASPFIVVGALALTMYFTTLHLPHNRWINFVAASSFAAYLLHSAPSVMVHFLNSVRSVYASSPGLLALLTIALLLAIYYMAALVLDQARIAVWNRIGDRVSTWTGRAFRLATDPDFLRDIEVRRPSREALDSVTDRLRDMRRNRRRPDLVAKTKHIINKGINNGKGKNSNIKGKRRLRK